MAEMSHDFHERLPGFDPGQILVDGCRECEARSTWNDRGISSLDPGRFVAAWERAWQWQNEGLATISDAERPLLDTLWSVRCMQSDRAFRFPVETGVSRQGWGPRPLTRSEREASKTKTERAAAAWLAQRGYNPDGTRTDA